MRLFVATRLEETWAERIRSAFEPARSRAGRASRVEAHAFHLTYAFIDRVSLCRSELRRDGAIHHEIAAGMLDE